MWKNNKVRIMPKLEPQMQGHGPLVYARFLPIDKKVSSLICLALLDTGASSSVIDSEFVKQIQVVGQGKGQTMTPHGQKEASYATLGLALSRIEGEYIPEFTNVLVSVMDFSQFAYKFIIGRDILSKCTFIYDGRNNVYSLEWD